VSASPYARVSLVETARRESPISLAIFTQCIAVPLVRVQNPIVRFGAREAKVSNRRDVWLPCANVEISITN
jgi:hypothetical protein